MSLSIKEFEEAHEKDMTALHRAVAFELAETMINAMPVDTGALKGSVNISKTEGDVIIDELDPSGSNTKSRIKNNLMQCDSDDNLYGTVGEQYAPYVDGGTSTQPPTAFFTGTISSLSNVVKRASDRIKEFRDA